MTKLTLYGYYRSSCSARLRIALDLKGIDYTSIYVNIKDDEHLEQDYTSINPSRSVPTLLIEESSSKWSITQSVSALEYLEDSGYSGFLLLPKDIRSRAAVRSLVNIIASDTQPPTNMRILLHAASFGADSQEWANFFTDSGLKAFEGVARETAGKYCVGDTISLADVCLIPALWNAERFKVPLDQFPTISRVYEALMQHPSFVKSHWQRQPDCPKELAGYTA